MCICTHLKNVYMQKHSNGRIFCLFVCHIENLPVYNWVYTRLEWVILQRTIQNIHHIQYIWVHPDPFLKIYSIRCFVKIQIFCKYSYQKMSALVIWQHKTVSLWKGAKPYKQTGVNPSKITIKLADFSSKLKLIKVIGRACRLALCQ